MPGINIPTDVVTLQDVKAHLRMSQTDTTDDMALMGFIAAVDDVVVAECGEVIPVHYDEYYDGGGFWVYLRHRPVLSVEAVEEGWGWFNYMLDYQPVNTIPASSMYAYSLDSPTIGGITRRSAGNVQIPFVPGTKNIHVWYTAGRATVPPSIRLGALEMIAHWYQNSQLRSMAGSQQYSSYDALNEDWTRATGITSINSGLPFRVLELLKRHRRIPIIG
jgi:hypothetical protein